LSPLIIIIPLASILFNIVLLAFKMDKYFFKIYLIGAILNIVLLVVLLFVFKFSIVGAAISLLISELIITGMAVVILHKKNINLLSFK
jgi:PST family polysaccharide transporter